VKRDGPFEHPPVGRHQQQPRQQPLERDQFSEQWGRFVSEQS
jgi:hypothetical protein